MSNYIVHNGQVVKTDELRHYGILGMKWGVRRSAKQLANASTKEDRDRAVESLNKHREKGTAEIAKLQKRNVKLTEKVEKQIIKNETKASKLRAKAAAKENKAYGFFTSQKRASKLHWQALKLDAKAEALETKSSRAKAYLNRNETMIVQFQREIANIDKALVDSGKRYIG